MADLAITSHIKYRCIFNQWSLRMNQNARLTEKSTIARLTEKITITYVHPRKILWRKLTPALQKQREKTLTD